MYGAFLVYETPGLGIGHFYYLSILLAALATGPWLGAFAGAGATGLYATGVVLNPSIQSSEVLSASTAIRLVTYVAVGGVIGYFAKESRRATAELKVLAERDAVTGLPNTRAFERAIGDRLAGEQPFVLLVGALAADGATAETSSLVNSVDELLIHALEPEDDLARIGHRSSPCSRPSPAPTTRGAWRRTSSAFSSAAAASASPSAGRPIRRTATMRSPSIAPPTSASTRGA